MRTAGEVLGCLVNAFPGMIYSAASWLRPSPPIGRAGSYVPVIVTAVAAAAINKYLNHLTPNLT